MASTMAVQWQSICCLVLKHQNHMLMNYFYVFYVSILFLSYLGDVMNKLKGLLLIVLWFVSTSLAFAMDKKAIRYEEFYAKNAGKHPSARQLQET